LREVYHYLTKEKRDRISNDDSGSGYITQDEHQQTVDKVEDQAHRDGRDEAVVSLYRHEDTDLSYQKIADALGMSKPGVQGIFERSEDDG
jgi:AraC-like DNA-binding protein